MKYLIALALFCALTTTASAQFILGGQFAFGVNKTKDEGGLEDSENTVTTVTVAPRLAYASGNNWFGADLGVSLVNDTDDFGSNDVTTKTTVAGIAPFFRHIWKPTDNMGLWLEGQVGATFGSQKDDDGDKTAEYLGITAGIRPGVIFFIGNHLSFEASFGRLGFSSFRVSDPDDSDNKTTTSNFGLSLNSNNFTLNETGTNIANSFLFGVNWMF